MKRRTFLAGMGGTVGAGAIAGAAEIAATGKGPIPRRPFGKTGRTLPVVGYPCLALKNGDQQAATEQLRRALDQGVDYFDVAPGFGREVADRAVAKGVSLISIKPTSRGLWPKGEKKTYNWWYRPLEDPAEFQLAMNWVLSLPGMVSTLPTSYFDVFDKTVTAARQCRPLPAEDLNSIKALAQTCTPIFKPGPFDEKRAAAFLDLPEAERYPSRLG